jgi:drug/metabolite transporter superfamily protein YnfA
MPIGVAVVVFVIWICLLWFGSIGLQATGMEPRKARFQALSAITGTGFTTREAEEIIGHPRRRTIASWLMFFGNAGIILFVILLLLYISSNATSIPVVHILAAMGGIVVVLAIIWSGVLDKLSNRLADGLSSSPLFVSDTSSREILHRAGDYSVVRVTIGDREPEAGSRLGDTRLAKAKLKILAIERGTRVLPSPKAGSIIRAGDHLLCYGKTTEINKLEIKS